MTIKQFFRELPLDPAIDFLEDRVSPIFVKEVRLILREKLFVVTHLLMLAIVGLYSLGTLLWAWSRHGAASGSDAESGVVLFTALQWMQAGALVMILPGVTATLISSERDNGTFDMLLGASLSPRKILWGKLLSALAITFLLMMSVLPISLAAPVLGGVDFGHVFRWYGTLGLLSVLSAMLSLCVSAVARTAAHAIIGSYAGGVGVLLLMEVMRNLLSGWSVLDYGATTFGFVRPEYLYPGVFSGLPQEMLMGLAFPLGTAVLLTALLYAAALFSVTPAHPTRPALLKILFLIISLAATGLLAAVASQPGGAADTPLRAAQGLAFLFTLAAVFAIDDLSAGGVSPLHAGAGNGAMYAWIATAVLSAAFGWFFSGLARHPGPLALGLAGWGFFCTGLAFSLRLLMPSTDSARTLYFSLMFLLLGLPILLNEVVQFTASPRDLNPMALINPLLFVDLSERYNLDWSYYFPVGAFTVGLLMSLACFPRLLRPSAPESE